MEETKKDNKGKIMVVVFLAVILLPICYALYREKVVKKQEQERIATPAASTAAPGSK